MNIREVDYIRKLLDPKVDYVFKIIFGHVGNEKITANLISAIVNKDITDLKLDNNTILEKDLLDDKIGILDIKAKIGNNINCNIEMQVVDRKNIEKRILFYWSKIYNRSIKSGKDYNTLEKGIIILISDYELNSLKEIKKYLSKWNVREEEYPQIVLTDILEIYIIEIPKFEKYKDKIHNKNLNLWMEFIKNPEVINMKEENPEVVNAKKVLEEISQDEHEIYLAELREKYIMDQKAIEDAAFDKGLDTAMIIVAKRMKKLKIENETISKVTGLEIEEIKKLD